MSKTIFVWVRTFALGLSLALTIAACGVKDSSIQEEITKKAATATELNGITASVKDGVVTLNGEFKDEATKAQAEATVKTIKGVKSVINNGTITPPPPAPAPVQITADDPLKTAVKDATKDFPGVVAEVNDGVITLTGEIKRSSLKTLMQSLNTLKPKKIENKLTIK
jgi:hyperosmotically inducible periplasmic protein